MPIMDESNPAYFDDANVRVKFVNQPHSRACTLFEHPHGTRCSANCPTCAGLPDPEKWNYVAAAEEEEQDSGVSTDGEKWKVEPGRVFEMQHQESDICAAPLRVGQGIDSIIVHCAIPVSLHQSNPAINHAWSISWPQSLPVGYGILLPDVEE